MNDAAGATDPSNPDVLGVDGCRGGWVAAGWSARTGIGDVLFAARFAELLARPEPVICIDMIIGLDMVRRPGGRAAERALRKALPGRTSSVFAAPPRAVLEASNYAEARRLCRAHSEPSLGLSAQTWGLVPKIREIDALMTPALETRVHEGHPEAAFAVMTGAPLRAGKKTPEGRARRRAALVEEGFAAAMLDARPRGPYGLVAIDDVLDACAMAWSADRIRRGAARLWPDTSVRDARGLRQAIFA